MEKQAAIAIIVNNIAKNIVSSSDDSSSDDDEEVAFTNGEKDIYRIPRVQNYIENVVVLLDDENFKSHFRMRRSTFKYLLERIRPKLLRKTHFPDEKCGRNTIDPEKQLLIAIWTFATPDSYRSVCDRFGIAKATAIRAVRRVTQALIAYAPQTIKWPEGEHARKIITEFGKKCGIPGVLGAIDGTHIKIAAPKEHHEAYINRKGFHSIQVQVVCDNTMKFIHCYVGHPGSVHDQRVFRLSDVQMFCSDHEKFPDNSHLIGDAAYCIQQHLLVPYKDNGHLTRREKNFNYCLSSTRMVIERAIGLLKGRWRSLLDKLPMTRTDLIPNYILACCVLHNICLQQNDLIEIPLIVNRDDRQAVRNVGNPAFRNEGLQKRLDITNTIPTID